MKPDVLQPISVAVMILGLFLAATGGFCAYYFAWKSERPDARQAAPAVSVVDARIPELIEQHAALENRIASIERQALAAAAKPKTIAQTPVGPDLFSGTPIPAPGPLRQPVKEHLPASPAKIELSGAAPQPNPPPIAKGPPHAPHAPHLPSPEIPQKPETVARHAGVRTLDGALHALGLSHKTGSALVQSLRAHRNGSIAIHVAEGGADAMDSARAWATVFENAGWHVSDVAAVKSHRKTRGVTVSAGTFPPPAEVPAIFSAMRAAGVKVSTDLDPNQHDHRAVVFIGKT